MVLVGLKHDDEDGRYGDDGQGDIRDDDGAKNNDEGHCGPERAQRGCW